MCSPDCFLALIAVLFPPLAVWVKRGICSGDSIINITLSIFGWLPGLLHAWYIIAKYPDPFEAEYVGYASNDPEQGRPRIYQPVPQRPGRYYNQPSRQNVLVYGQHHPPPPEREGYGSFNVTPASEPHPGHPHASAGPSGDPSSEPPSYASVVKGDNKVQHD